MLSTVKKGLVVAVAAATFMLAGCAGHQQPTAF